MQKTSSSELSVTFSSMLWTTVDVTLNNAGLFFFLSFSSSFFYSQILFLYLSLICSNCLHCNCMIVFLITKWKTCLHCNCMFCFLSQFNMRNLFTFSNHYSLLHCYFFVCLFIPFCQSYSILFDSVRPI